MNMLEQDFIGAFEMLKRGGSSGRAKVSSQNDFRELGSNPLAAAHNYL